MLKALIFGVVGVVVLGAAAFFVLGLVSQKGEAPGLVDGRLASCPDSPNCVSSEESAPPEKAVAPLAPEAWDSLAQVIAAQGGTITSQSEDYIAAEFKSAVFGFVDDVEFRRAEERVHLRSASRVGYSDGGANAKRVARLREALLKR
ncbi:DUF1499 domain-containing protein [Erythrobacter sp. SCSIO 43205]|uniref:DUF1499 domain-containing protein n=1 Tax=Erythrobacter sp. SCSIO 43205 TaxID=2779361 RepID=UPI001CA7BB83|nr:DUF1499 domain-containing protein [Erythrobacter sp. SCSIO 43205]UAB77951.1 DUF1499 domain-containing protein [Erythrobacter sp. SCSIO 43205]